MSNNAALGTILLVDDEPNITDLLRYNLSSEGFDVHVEPNASEVRIDDCDEIRMIIVDAMKQEYSGLDLTRDLKSNQNTSEIPVMICTMGEGEEMVIKAFDSGADDFVSKPFSLRELLARVRAVLRRHPQKNSAEQRARHTRLYVPKLEIEIDLVNQRVLENGVVVPLTKTEYAILVYLLKNQNEFFSRETICEEVWKGEENSNPRIVDTNISRLRKKLGESGKYIINRYGMGYGFVDKLS